MAEIENIHCPICTQLVANGLPPELAKLEQRGAISTLALKGSDHETYIYPITCPKSQRGPKFGI